MKELKPSHRSKKLLDDFFVFDTETGDTLKNGDIKWKLDARPESFIFGCVYGKGYKRTITSVREFHQEFMHPRYKGKKVFAHNAEYDLNCLFGNIYQFDNNAIFNGKFISATNGNCTFADSLNIYKASVKDIGEKMGYPKLTLGNKLVSKGGYSEQDIEYCYRDCEIIWFALLKIFEDAGSIKITQASLSLNLFRTRFLRYGIQHNELNEEFRNAYYGGRCECFYIGDVEAQVIDRNSAYPAEMEKLRFPDPAKLCFEEYIPVSRAKMLMNQYEGCIYCEVVHYDSWIGYLPVKKDLKLIFPLGHFSGCWTFNEIRFALEKGMIKIKSVQKIVYAPTIDSPFSEYVKIKYAERFATDDKLEIERIKIFMNSLYGKFGASKKEQNIYLPDWRQSATLIKEHINNKTFIDLMLFNDTREDAFLIVQSKEDLGVNGMSYSIVSLAAYITAGQRVNLLRKGLELYEKKMNPVYCDTDSWFYWNKGVLPDEKELGGWKRENKMITRLDGLKNYQFEYIVSKEYIEKNEIKKFTKISDDKFLIIERKIKGVPKKAEKIGENRYQFLTMVRTKESLRRNIDSGIFEVKEKTLNLKYDKRIVKKDGTTKPIVL